MNLSEKKHSIGIDLGSSSVKMTLFNLLNGENIDAVTYPQKEMKIESPKKDWAEQDPQLWWNCVKECFYFLKKRNNLQSVISIGISYQMHGLVAIDDNGDILFPSIIWCDSRAIKIGEDADKKLSKSLISDHLLNSPGNFTASKLRWVKENNLNEYSSIYKFMLPGDYLLFKLTGKLSTTKGGLSEGILWDFENEKISEELINFYGIEKNKFPDVVDSFGDQGTLLKENCHEFGLNDDVVISYRCGDQPNNAFSLNVLEPGEIAATAGTSAVIYCVSDKKIYDQNNRINTFLHCNNSSLKKRNGILLCVNGSGIAYSWIKKILGEVSYSEMDKNAESIKTLDDLIFFPFGNGSERIFSNNTNIKSMFHGIDFNRHNKYHLIKSVLEGVSFSLSYGIELLRDMGIEVNTVKVGNQNLFKSKIFRKTFVNISKVKLLVYETDGSIGAARGAGIGIGYYKDEKDAFQSLECVDELNPSDSQNLEESYLNWKMVLNKLN